MPTAIHHPDVDLHRRPGHPERPGRTQAVLAGLDAVLGGALALVEAEEATRAMLERVHPAAYLARLETHCAAAEPFDPDTYVGPASYRAAALAAGAAVAAVEIALAGAPALAVVRPPGHHAGPARPGGFCLLSNVAVAVRHAQSLGVARIAVLDWDVHHGNGTQAVFWEDPSVLVVSLHAYGVAGWAPFFPGSGAADEVGAGAGRGTTLNVPLAPGTGPDAYLRRFRDAALPAVEAFAPELVVVSCGFDAHHRDPLGVLELEAATFGAMAVDLRGLTRRLGLPPAPLVLEGGYDLDALTACAAAVAESIRPEAGSGGTAR